MQGIPVRSAPDVLQRKEVEGSTQPVVHQQRHAHGHDDGKGAALPQSVGNRPHLAGHARHARLRPHCIGTPRTRWPQIAQATSLSRHGAAGPELIATLICTHRRCSPGHVLVARVAGPAIRRGDSCAHGALLGGQGARVTRRGVCPPMLCARAVSSVSYRALQHRVQTMGQERVHVE